MHKLNKDEMREAARQRPGYTDANFEAAWKRFESLKKAKQDN
jgi:hypothetical protein